MTEPTRRNLDFAEVMEEIANKRSSRELGKLTGISHTYIADWRWGRPPSFQMLERFCEALGVPTDTQARLFRVAGYAAPVSLMNRLVDVAAADEDEFREAVAGSNPTVRGAFSEKAADSLLTAAERGELTYEPEMEDVRVEAFTGRVSESDREELERVVRYLRDRQRRRSMGEPE